MRTSCLASLNVCLTWPLPVQCGGRATAATSRSACVPNIEFSVRATIGHRNMNVNKQKCHVQAKARGGVQREGESTAAGEPTAGGVGGALRHSGRPGRPQRPAARAPPHRPAAGDDTTASERPSGHHRLPRARSQGSHASGKGNNWTFVGVGSLWASTPMQ